MNTSWIRGYELAFNIGEKIVITVTDTNEKIYAVVTGYEDNHKMLVVMTQYNEKWKIAYDQTYLRIQSMEE
jgi:hypothetical protein